MAKDTYLTHFKTKIKQNERNYLTRENYCVPTSEPSYKVRKNIRIVQEFFEINNRYPGLAPDYYCNIPNRIFADEEHYTKEYVENHYNDCMKNFDLNMQFFSTLDTEEFNKHLMSFVKRNRFKEIDDLQTVSQIEGVYILVLDKYNQVYIGVSSDIKRRILSHWSRKKEFDHLICGRVEESILSIDSFGALDTTRIFHKPCGWWEKDKAEEKYIAKFKSIYRLNRVAGGLNSEEDRSLRNLMLETNIQKRSLDK